MWQRGEESAAAALSERAARAGDKGRAGSRAGPAQRGLGRMVLGRGVRAEGRGKSWAAELPGLVFFPLFLFLVFKLHSTY